MKDETYGGFYYAGILIGISSLVYSILILYCGYTEYDYWLKLMMHSKTEAIMLGCIGMLSSIAVLIICLNRKINLTRRK